jgi:hypothetical protein
VTPRFCRIHGKDGHRHILVCNVCLEPLDAAGQPTCGKRCNGPVLMRWTPSQDTWRCVEGLIR